MRHRQVAVVGDAPDHVADLPYAASEHQVDVVRAELLVEGDEHACGGDIRLTVAAGG